MENSMEASTSGSTLISGDSSPRTLNRANRPLQLPTVCVSSIPSTFSAVVAAAVAQSPLNSPVFVDTNNQTHQINDLHTYRLASGGATSAMMFLPYRHERTSSSSSDSGVIFQFSPPAGTLGPCPSSASLSISPPGLSPLQLDSAFSTPTPSSGNRFRSHFTFDHVNSPRRKPENAFDLSAAVVLQQQQQQTSAAMISEIMKRAGSTASSSGIVSGGSISSNTDLEEELKRKQEELVAKGFFSSPIKNNVFRSESLPLQPEVEKMMQTLYQASQQQSPQFLSRSPVSRTASLNVQGPSPLLTAAWNAAREHMGQVKPFASAQSAFKVPNSLIPSVMTNPPKIQTTSPSPPQRPRNKTKLTGASEENDDAKKQYFCVTCNKDFRRPDILSRHLRRHTGEKPFGCDKCGRYFSRSDHLRTHRRTHTDEKPYACTVCNYRARRRDVLTRHMSTRHQQKAERTFFPRQRRCLSETVVNPLNIKTEQISNVENTLEKISPKRQRFATEILKTDVKEELEEEIIDVLNVDNDVVIDEFQDKSVKQEPVDHL